MPRARSPARDMSYEIYKEHDGDITNRAIAGELGISEKTIGGWKSKDNWDKKLKEESEESNGVLQTTERSTPNEKGSKNIKNSKKGHGNPSPVKKFTKRNQVARKHGLFAKYLNADQLEIIEDFQETSIADQLWIQIEIKFSAIMQLQKVMWVSTADDHLQVETGHSEGVVSNTSYKVAFAYERYESYINAQTRAMAEYRNLVKHFLALVGEDDERRLKVDIMQADLDQKREEVKQLKGVDHGTTTVIVKNEDEMRKRMKESEQKKHDDG